MRDNSMIPHWPRWYCGKFLGHHWYLSEVRKINETESEYVCRACGWRGVKKRPSNFFRALF